MFRNEGLWKVWTWCLLKARHKKGFVSFKTGKHESEIELLPGQFIFGRKTAAKELGMKESTVRNRIGKLKKLQNLAVKTDTHCSIITVINWDSYQPPKEKEDRQQDRHRTGTGHKQEGKEGKEVIKTLSGKPADVEIIFNYWQEVHNHKRAKLDDTRKKKIKDRLKDGYSVEEIKMAINGCKLSPHHMGKNDNGTTYDDISLICRDATHLDGFIKQKEKSKANEW